MKTQHIWIRTDLIPNAQICEVCCVVRRSDDKNSPCKGTPKIVLRSLDDEGATLAGGDNDTR